MIHHPATRPPTEKGTTMLIIQPNDAVSRVEALQREAAIRRLRGQFRDVIRRQHHARRRPPVASPASGAIARPAAFARAAAGRPAGA